VGQWEVGKDSDTSSRGGAKLCTRSGHYRYKQASEEKSSY